MATQDNIQQFLNEPVASPNANAPTMPPRPLNTNAVQASQNAQTGNASTQGKVNPAARTQPSGKVSDTIAATGSDAAIAATNVVAGIAGSVGTVGDSIEQWANNLPTPGGIAILLGVLLLLLWAVIPVNSSNGQSYTRLQLLFYTLTGRTSIGGPAEQTTGQTSAPNAGNGTGGTALFTPTPVPTATNGTGILPLSNLQVLNLPDFSANDFTVM